jgi:nitrous oxidase accessory protein NosD
MIKPWSSSGNNAATVAARNMTFNLAHVSDYGVMDLIRYAGKLEVSNCVFNIATGMAFYSDYCNNTWIVNNIVNGGAIQIRLDGATESANIISNRFLDFTSYGIKADGSSTNDLIDIVISSNVLESSEANAIRGVHAKYVDNCQIKGNIIKLTAANLGSSGGIYIEEGHRVAIESNDIYVVNADVGNSFGIYFNIANGSSIDKNIIPVPRRYRFILL